MAGSPLLSSVRRLSFSPVAFLPPSTALSSAIFGGTDCPLSGRVTLPPFGGRTYVLEAPAHHAGAANDFNAGTVILPCPGIVPVRIGHVMQPIVDGL